MPGTYTHMHPCFCLHWGLISLGSEAGSLPKQQLKPFYTWHHVDLQLKSRCLELTPAQMGLILEAPTDCCVDLNWGCRTLKVSPLATLAHVFQRATHTQWGGLSQILVQSQRGAVSRDKGGESATLLRNHCSIIRTLWKFRIDSYKQTKQKNVCGQFLC